jgi:hypothetical protein
MQTVLRDLTPQVCLVYLDDIIVLGRDTEEHIRNLRSVFERFRQVGLKLNPKKCHYFKQEVTYLGHVVSKNGIQTDPTKVEKVKTWPEPCTADELRSFLGLASYYRKFVPHFSSIVAPLNVLLTKNKEFVWGEEQRNAFHALRKALCESAILKFPDFSPHAGPFILDTSDTGIGAVLAQKDYDGAERVIAYGSRTLNKSEKNYCTTRKEVLSVVHFMKYYRHFLLGRRFILRTDHKALTRLHTL